MLEKALRVTLQAAQISLFYSSFFWRASHSSSDQGPKTLQIKSFCVPISLFPTSKTALQVVPLRTFHFLEESLLVVQSPDSCWCLLGSWEWSVCLCWRSVWWPCIYVYLWCMCVRVSIRNSNLSLTTSCTRNFTSAGWQILPSFNTLLHCVL